MLGELVKIGLSEDIIRAEVAKRTKKLHKDKYLSQEPRLEEDQHLFHLLEEQTGHLHIEEDIAE